MSFRCGAKRKGIDRETGLPRGGTCQNPVAQEGKKCRIHGGRSLVGMASGTYKGRRGYVKNLPTRMAEAITERVGSFTHQQDQRSLRHEIELADALQGEELAKIRAGLTSDWLRAAKSLVERVMLEQQAGTGRTWCGSQRSSTTWPACRRAGTSTQSASCAS